MRVEVVYALPDEQHLMALDVAPGTTAIEAVRTSGICERAAGADPAQTMLGIFGQACGHDAVLRAGDRVEILRPLQLDPKEARRLRAGSRSSGRASSRAGTKGGAGRYPDSDR